MATVSSAPATTTAAAPQPASPPGSDARHGLDPHAHGHHRAFWLWVMCLTGVDYFSTLGYQPSIAFEFTGMLAPLTTVLLVLVTLLGAYPIYSYVAGESFRGQGSIAMLERLLHGWKGKFLVLVLLGFAATDFVITKTLSAADAAVHLVQNPIYIDHAPEALRGQMLVTMILLVGLGAMFLRGFKEVIGIAVMLVAAFLLLNFVVVGSGLVYLLWHPDLISAWVERVCTGDWHIEASHLPVSGTSGWSLLAVCIILFPKLALGLSGFETGVAVMPLVQGDPDDDPARPAGRIRNARKLLLTAAIIMSSFLLGSSLVTTMLIPPEDLAHGGKAFERALAYIAHAEGPHNVNPTFGKFFGTAYDIATIAILWFAGASAMSGLLNLVPQYLPGYGMAPEWARAMRPLVLLFTAINLFVTWVFDASVHKQGGAYATGVMVLITSACVAVVIDSYRKAKARGATGLAHVPWRYVAIAAVFIYTALAVMIEKPDGIKIASCFVAAMLISSMTSRIMRSTELRFTRFEFVDDESRFLWDTLRHLEFPVLVPHRPGHRSLKSKEESIRQEHRLGPEVPIVFVEAELGDVSEFVHCPLIAVRQEEDRFIIRATRCASIAHVIATVALELSKVGRPPEVHFGWSDESPLAANLRFVLFGEGNVPWLVHELIQKAEPNPERQPRVVIG